MLYLWLLSLVPPFVLCCVICAVVLLHPPSSISLLRYSFICHLLASYWLHFLLFSFRWCLSSIPCCLVNIAAHYVIVFLLFVMLFLAFYSCFICSVLMFTASILFYGVPFLPLPFLWRAFFRFLLCLSFFSSLSRSFSLAFSWFFFLGLFFFSCYLSSPWCLSCIVFSLLFDMYFLLVGSSFSSLCYLFFPLTLSSRFRILYSVPPFLPKL